MGAEKYADDGTLEARVSRAEEELRAADERAARIERQANMDRGFVASVNRATTTLTNAVGAVHTDIKAMREENRAHFAAAKKRDLAQNAQLDRLIGLILALLAFGGTTAVGASTSVTMSSTIGVAVLALLFPNVVAKFAKQRLGLDVAQQGNGAAPSSSSEPPTGDDAPTAHNGKAPR